MKNSKLRRALLLVACAVMLVSVSVSATLAYLTSKTEVVTNTFSVGNVTITLDEKDIDNSKTNVTTEGRDMQNDYKLLPNKQFEKDPTVHVATGSEPCYIFVKVVNEIAAIEKQPAEGETDTTTIAAQMTAKGWKRVDNVADVWCYYGLSEDGAVNSAPAVVNADTSVKVFETFTISQYAHNNTPGASAELNIATYVDAQKTIKVTAYAIQSQGWTAPTAADLWTAGGFQ